MPIGQDDLMIPLPEDRESVRVVVWQDGELLVDQIVDCAQGTFPVTIYGSGETHIKVEIDGEVYMDKRITVDVYNG